MFLKNCLSTNTKVVFGFVFFVFFITVVAGISHAAIQKKYQGLEPFDSESYQDQIYDIEVEDSGSYYYAVGVQDVTGASAYDGGWTVQQRSRANDSVLWEMEYGASNYSRAYSVVEEGDYIYVCGGYNFQTYWRYERRNKSDGSVDWAVNNDPANNGHWGKACRGQQLDSTYIYSVGHIKLSTTDHRSRFEKRQKSDGSLVNSRDINPTSYKDYLYDVTISGSYGYAVGQDNNGSGDGRWRIEKFNLSDLSSVQVVSVDPTVENDAPLAVVNDGTYIYIAGQTSTGARVDRRLMTDLSVDWSLDTSATSYRDIVYYDGLIYLVGNQTSGDGVSSEEAIIEIRDASDGSLVESYSSNTSDGTDLFHGLDIVVGATTQLVAGGYDGSLASVQWLLEDWIELAPGTPSISDVSAYTTNGTEITMGGYLRSLNMEMRITASDSEVPDVLTPEVEIQPIGTSFTDTATHIGDDINVSGTPIVADVTVDGLSDGTGYHAQVRVCDDEAKCTFWTSFNANAESSPDFITDVTNPNDPVITESSHEIADWSNDNTIDLEWEIGTDATSGVAGYSYEWSREPLTLPDTTIDLLPDEDKLTSPELEDGNDHYFHLRTKDEAGNWTSTLHEGPYYIDVTPPTGKVTINDGDDTTYSPTVDISLTGSNPDAGISDIKICNLSSLKGCYWRDFEDSMTWGLLSGFGEKKVYFKLRSPTGDTSPTYHDAIEVVMPPYAASPVISTIQVIGSDEEEDDLSPDEGIIQELDLDMADDEDMTFADTTPAFTGTAEPGALVMVTLLAKDGGRGASGTVTADDDGNWTWEPLDPLDSGSYDLVVKAEGESGEQELERMTISIEAEEGEPLPTEQNKDVNVPDEETKRNSFFLWILAVGVPILVALILIPVISKKLSTKSVDDPQN